MFCFSRQSNVAHLYLHQTDRVDKRWLFNEGYMLSGHVFEILDKVN